METGAKRWIILLALTGVSRLPVTLAQAGGTGEMPQPDISLEEIISETEDETYATAVYEDLVSLASNPLDLNAATAEDLARLYFLNDFQIFSILDYRHKYGAMLSLSELRLIPGLREDLIAHILPYVTIGNPSLAPVSPTLRFRPRQTLLLRTRSSLPLREGFSSECDTALKFRGPPLSRLMKYEIRQDKDLRAGFTFESDAGERIPMDIRYGLFDFNSAFVELSHKGPVREAVIGDFRYETGCGLVNGTGRRGKSSQVILKQKNAGISRYASTSEAGFNRGAAVMLALDHWIIRGMLSRTKISASVLPDTDSTTVFTSTDLAGLHRNAREEPARNNLLFQQLGGGMGYSSGRLSANYNVLLQHFSKAYRYRIIPSRLSPVREQDRFTFHSLDFSYRDNRFLINGEVAAGDRRHPAILSTVTAWLHPLLTLNMSYRYYDPEYFCLNASAFAESDVRNEEGLYAGLEAAPFPFLNVSAYIDGYRFPLLRYFGVAPERGRDILLKTEFRTKPDVVVTTVLKYEKKLTGAVRDQPGIAKPGTQADFRAMAEMLLPPGCRTDR